MKKYLFLLAFILPFMAMGQAWNFPDTPHKGWKRDDHGILTLDTTYLKKDSIVKSWRKVYSFDSGIETQKGYLSASDKKKLDSIPGYVIRCPRDDSEWQTDLVPEHMPTVDGNKNGVMDALISGTATTSFTGPIKDSIVKGWIFYAKKAVYWNGKPPVRFLPAAFMQGYKATAHYKPLYGDVLYVDRYGYYNQPWGIYKIEVDGKPFDLNKYYQFIPENQVVE